MGLVVKQGFVGLDYLLSFITTYHYLIATFLAVILGVLVYFLLLFLTKEIKYNDLLMIPRVGERLARICKKIGLVRE